MNRPLAILTALFAATASLAQGSGGPATPAQPAAAEARQATAGGETNQAETFGGPLWDRGNLLGDPFGLRSAGAQRGLTFGLSETFAVLGNATGGVRRGVVAEGLLQMGVGLDTEKAGLWPGGTFNASAYQIHGRGLSFDNLANNGNTVSGIEALRGTLLFELWYEQSFLDRAVSIRLGQLAADQEFAISQYGALFINHTFGWSTLPSADLPSAGPSFPLAAPGIRLRYSPAPEWTGLFAIFNGNPAGPGNGVPQSRDPSGTAFRLNDGTLFIAELQHTLGGEGGLPGTYKLGGWYSTDVFQDQRAVAGGISLADPRTDPNATGRPRRNNWSLYGVADQLVWRKPDSKDGGIGVFIRMQGAPGDRNLINFALDVGATWKGALPGRDSDTAGIAFSLSRNSDTSSRLDKDIRALNPSYPIRRHESVLELTYQAQIAPWLQVQPVAQYLFNLNGGVLNPQQPTKRLGDAAVFGVQNSVTF